MLAVDQLLEALRVARLELEQERPLPGHVVTLEHALHAIKSGDEAQARAAGATSMVSRERIESILDRVRPLLQADGGDIELVDVHGNSAKVRLTGMCAGCPSAHMTLYMGVECAIRDEIREFEQLELV